MKEQEVSRKQQTKRIHSVPKEAEAASGDWVTSSQAYGNFLPEVNRLVAEGFFLVLACNRSQDPFHNKPSPQRSYLPGRQPKRMLIVHLSA